MTLLEDCHQAGHGQFSTQRFKQNLIHLIPSLLWAVNETDTLCSHDSLWVMLYTQSGDSQRILLSHLGYTPDESWSKNLPRILGSYLVLCLSFFSFLFLAAPTALQEFPGQGSSPGHSSDQSHGSDNAGAFTGELLIFCAFLRGRGKRLCVCVCVCTTFL